jgi:hypothetical protein
VAALIAPLANWLGTGDHPLRALARGSFAVAGMDLVLLSAAAVAGLAARCRALGTAALALGLGASLWAEGPSFGSLLWVLGLAGGRPERDVHAQPSPALAARRRAHDRPRLG